MPSSSLRHSLRRLWALDKFSYSLRVFIALGGSLALCWHCLLYTSDAADE